MELYYRTFEKHKQLIAIAIEKMKQINDYEHDINHVLDVVELTKRLMSKLDKNFDIDVCIISAYWHDVGRTIDNENHEKISAELLKQEMKKLDYDNKMIDKCYNAIVNHRWDMNPTTIEGLILKDADKLAFLGENRWNRCLNNNQRLDEIINLLPRLKNEILFFEESRKIYDDMIIELVKKIYNKVVKNV